MMTISTPKISRPRAATSVATKILRSLSALNCSITRTRWACVNKDEMPTAGTPFEVKNLVKRSTLCLKFEKIIACRGLYFFKTESKYFGFSSVPA